MSNRQALGSTRPSRNVKNRIRDLLPFRESLTSGGVARELGVTRQAVHPHLRQMVRDGELRAVGAGRGARYERVAALTRRYSIPALSEDVVWEEVRTVDPIREAPSNVMTLLGYAFTEMLNNAIDHSGGSFVDVSILAPQGGVAFEVRDDGIGALRRARETFGLENDVDAIAEFSKGKRTTMPERHSGEGIFFTSKAMDRFVLTANGVRWIVDNIADDQALGDAPGEAGTRVRCEISLSSSRTLRSVFDRYSLAPEEMPAFDRTTTRLELVRLGRSFLSRSEAKRLAVGLDAFGEAEIDFRGVTDVGQGFVDELFRVWAAGHPTTRLVPVNMGPAVRVMVERGMPRGGP